MEPLSVIVVDVPLSFFLLLERVTEDFSMNFLKFAEQKQRPRKLNKKK